MHDIPPGYGGPIQEPSVNDVLSGRGGRINSHPGNVQFRQLVNQYKHVYLSKQTKKLEKVNIADKIVKAIRTMDPPGRFLKEDTKIQMWVEIGDQRARKKAGQAMRENADETRKELAEQETNNDGTLTNHQVFDESNSRNDIMLQQTVMNGSPRNIMYPTGATNRFEGEPFSTSNPSYALGQTLYATDSDLRNGPARNFEYRNLDGRGVAAAHFLDPRSFVQEGFASSSLNTGIVAGHPTFGQISSSTGNFGTMTSQGLHHTSVVSSHNRDDAFQQTCSNSGGGGGITTGGNVNVFDREFHTLGNSNSSGSGGVQSISTSGIGMQSLNVSGLDSAKRSSSSSTMSYISTGILSPDELLYLASQQQRSYQQHHEQQQPQQQQQYFGNLMNTFHEGLEWNSNAWDQNLVSSRDLQYANMENEHGTLGQISEVNSNSNSSSIQNKDRRRLFRENREKSQTIIPSGVKRAASGDDKQGLRESQLLKESIGTLDSMIIMDSKINMSSMGMGSTNMLSMYSQSGRADYDASAFTEQAPESSINNDKAFISGKNPRRMSSNESLMRVLAEAASKSEQLSSESSFPSSHEPDTSLSKSADNSGSMPSTNTSGRSFSSPSTSVGGMKPSKEPRVEAADDDKNKHGFATNLSTASEYNHFTNDGATINNYQRILPLGRRESHHQQESTTHETPHQVNIDHTYSFPSQEDKMTDAVGRMRAPPQRILTRRISGISTKSDVSMGDLSWNYDLGMLGSLQSVGDFDMNESRLRLFSENSTRYVQSCVIMECVFF